MRLLLHQRNLLILLFLAQLHSLSGFESQSLNKSSSTMAARSLDSLLQDYAYRAFPLVHPRTGTPYNGTVPSNLTGINITATRLRNGSFRKRGIEKYNEFRVPKGVLVSPYVKRLALVYQNLGNWSEEFYPLPGFTFIAPVLGLLAYDAANLTATNLPELDIRASIDHISIVFSDVKLVPEGSESKCVRFDSKGLVYFSNVVRENTCSSIQQGHFSIVIESVAPAPAPISPVPTRKTQKSESKKWVIVGSVLGGLVLLMALLFLVLCLKKCKQKKEVLRMERAGESEVALRTTTVGVTGAPTAMITRTQPTLETERAS